MTKKFAAFILVTITIVLALSGLSSCASNPPAPIVTMPAPKCDCDKVIAKPPVVTAPPTSQALPETKTPEPKIADYGLLKPATWEDVDGFAANAIEGDQANLAWPAWMQSCSTLINKPAWKNVCSLANSLNLKTAGKPNSASVRAYFMQYFSVYQTTNADGTSDGLITGYYEPLLKGSRTKTAKYANPLYSAPEDLVTVELEGLYPDLKYKRIRGRLVGNKLVPYYTRAEIEAENSPIQQHAFIYIDDIIDVFYLQVQGSGLVQLENGEQIHVGYADQNGYTYNSIGRLLVERGELPIENASMNGIKNWAKANPDKLRDLLNNNPSYVFFRELPAGLPGPLGALGVPILAERVVAIDPKYVPLGAPVFLSTTQPNSTQALKRLMMAQDTGGAIKGGVRADFYWGSGFEAGAKAGAMKQAGKIWVFLPKDFVFPQAAATP
ncbi:MAG TPA: murein transglycosylase A [Methylotenera sp.]|nr:murein transglycosylase A [Methylotenera sp.]HPH04612.1 murein transglycosylase A [Methylotenera sp.]HPN01615.1 murein transglycosylase A [Methylotenera sp.]